MMADRGLEMQQSARAVMITNPALPAVGAPAQVGMQAGPTYSNQTAAGHAQSILNANPKLQIRQLRELVQALLGWQSNNRYVIRDQNGGNLFYMQEHSECWERNCLAPDCKAWRMDIYVLGPNGVSRPDEMVPFMHLERPCTCTCYCLNRPVVDIYELPSNRRLGSILSPFAFCNLSFEVMDASGNLVLRSDTGCCAPGLICACPCSGTPCNEVEFPVTDANTGSQVAAVHKYWMWGDNCPMLGEWGNYWVEFGQCSNPDYKVLLLALAVFIQMRYFDSRNQQ